MRFVERLHEAYGHERRTTVLTRHFSRLILDDASLLDVGCGDGLLDRLLLEDRPGLTIRGIDVLARPSTPIPVRTFDGLHIPFPDRSFDAVLFVDVLHHSEDPVALLREAVRVSRGTLLLKDHTLEGAMAGATLRFMDDVGNARHGVSLPHLYWPRSRWNEVFDELGLEVETWLPRLGLYPWPASLLFDRSLHFIARLTTGGGHREP